MPAPFGDAADVEGAGRRLDAYRALLRREIGGHDRRAPRLRARRATARETAARHPASTRVRSQVHADDAGGRDQHLLDRDSRRSRGDLGCHRLRRLEPLIARARVGAAAVDDHGAHEAAGVCEIGARHEDRRGLHLVRREERRARRRLCPRRSARCRARPTP